MSQRVECYHSNILPNRWRYLRESLGKDSKRRLWLYSKFSLWDLMVMFFCKFASSSLLTSKLEIRRWQLITIWLRFLLDKIKSSKECKYQHEKHLAPKYFFFKLAHPGHFFIYFRLFKHTLQILQPHIWKNVHPVDSAGIWTHNLQDMSLLP